MRFILKIPAGTRRALVGQLESRVCWAERAGSCQIVERDRDGDRDRDTHPARFVLSVSSPPSLGASDRPPHTAPTAV